MPLLINKKLIRKGKLDCNSKKSVEILVLTMPRANQTQVIPDQQERE